MLAHSAMVLFQICWLKGSAPGTIAEMLYGFGWLPLFDIRKWLGNGRQYKNKYTKFNFQG
jgi:hypothetical protein